MVKSSVVWATFDKTRWIDPVYRVYKPEVELGDNFSEGRRICGLSVPDEYHPGRNL